MISAYSWLPFLLGQAYLSGGEYVSQSYFDSFGAQKVLHWLVTGRMLDAGRLPVLTALLAVGIVAAIVARKRQALLAVALFVAWLALYFGHGFWGPLADPLPFGDILLFHRFVGGVQLAAILLIGIAADAIWRACSLAPRRWGMVLATLVLGALLVPALRERRSYYADNTTWMEQTADAIDADADARTILATLAEQPPGRTYAGLRDNFGEELNFGVPFRSVRFSDLLTFYQVPSVSAPYQSMPITANLAWHFDDQNAAHYDVFNVRYLVAPGTFKAPPFLRVIKRTPRYTLYGAQTSGYAEFAASIERQAAGPDRRRCSSVVATGCGPRPGGAGVHPLRLPGPERRLSGPVTPGCVDGGMISGERVQAGALDAPSPAVRPATLVLKMTYHPNWRVTVDGRKQPIFMVSPGYIGVELTAGPHLVHAEYDAGYLKYALFTMGAALLAVLVLLRRRMRRWTSGCYGAARRVAEAARTRRLEGRCHSAPGPSEPGRLLLRRACRLGRHHQTVTSVESSVGLSSRRTRHPRKAIQHDHKWHTTVSRVTR